MISIYKKFLVFSLCFLPFSASAETLTYYHNTGDDAGYTLDGSVYYGNTFTTDTTNLVVTRIRVLGKKVGSPTTCPIGIRATSANLPTGAYLTSVLEDVSAWSTSDAWHSIDVADYTLLASTEYAITAECTGNTFTWRGDSSGTFSPDYIVWDNAPLGSFTGKDNTQALMFEIYTDVVPSPAPTWATSTDLSTGVVVAPFLAVFLMLAVFFSTLFVMGVL